MRIAVAGARGRLGSWLVEHEPGTAALRCDCADPEAVGRAVAEIKPDVIINCAAWTRVDAAEDPANREAVIRANVRVPGVLRRSFTGLLIHISTGFVYHGGDWALLGCRYYKETDDGYNPVNFYSLSKLGGETAAILGRGPTLIVRTLDLFGPTILPGKEDFVQSAVRLMRAREPFRVHQNVYKQPTYIPDFAFGLSMLAHLSPPAVGVLHYAGYPALLGRAWVAQIAAAYGLGLPEVLNVGKPRVPRPLRSALAVGKARSLRLPITNPAEALAKMVREGR
jgi:dTDP-4-dehydrorhamnose reductase